MVERDGLRIDHTAHAPGAEHHRRARDGSQIFGRDGAASLCSEEQVARPPPPRGAAEGGVPGPAPHSRELSRTPRLILEAYVHSRGERDLLALQGVPLEGVSESLVEPHLPDRRFGLEVLLPEARRRAVFRVERDPSPPRSPKPSIARACHEGDE